MTTQINNDAITILEEITIDIDSVVDKPVVEIKLPEVYDWCGELAPFDYQPNY